MARTIACTIILLFAAALAGCGSVASSFDGHAVTARSALLSSVELRGVKGGYVIRLGDKTVRVWSDHLTWNPSAHLDLPAGWSRLDLADSCCGIVVTVDGKKLATIDPSA